MTVATVALALLAAVALSIAAADGSRIWMAIEVVVQSSLAMLASILAARYARRSASPPAVSPLLVGLGLLTIPLELILRVFDTGRAFEVVLMDGLKFVALGLAAVSCWPAYRRLAVLMSLFVLLFAASLSNDVAVQTLVAAYAVIGVGWAVAANWEELRPRLAATERSGVPKWWLVVLGVILLAGLATIGMGERDIVQSLRGFLPSSGGDGSGWHDPYAREGVGDGDALVAGSKDVQSFAPIENAPFLADDKPSLYDVFDDTFSEPYPPRKQERAVALRRNDLVRRRCEKLAETKQAGREFSTHRKGGQSKTHVSDRDSPALLFVAGRTPLHLRMETFDLFDGVRWYPEPVPETPPLLRAVESNGRTWIAPATIPEALDLFAGGESHAIKLVNLTTARIPAPLQLTGICIDKIASPDFFGWAQKSIPRMDRESIPSLTVISIASRLLEAGSIEEEVRHLGANGERYSQLPASLDAGQIAALAREWTEGVPQGWSQVEAVVARLREGYVHDPKAGTPRDCGSPVDNFLFESRRGPSYQFATAAAVLLRSLGYSTRLVRGFYADPADYSRRMRHTPVLADDAHFWCEVYLSAGTWATVEPTPGYEVLGPPPGLWDRTLAAARAALAFCSDNAAATFMLSICGLFLIHQRRNVADAMATATWRLLRPFRTDRDTVLAAVRLLEHRCRFAGCSRPPARTPGRWLWEQFRPTDQAERDNLWVFLAAADWAAFAPSDTEPPENALVACRAVVESQTLQRLHNDFHPRTARLAGIPRAWLRHVPQLLQG